MFDSCVTKMPDDADKIRAALALLQEAALSGKATGPTSPTIEALSARYQREYARHQKSAVDKARIAKTLVRFLGDRPALSLSTADVENYRDRRRARRSRLNKPLSAASLNREIGQLRHLLNWSVKMGLIPHNPIVRVELEREDNIRRTKVRSEDDLKAILGQLGDSVMRALILMLIDCGCRRMEAITLRWDQVDFARARIELYKAKNDDARVFKVSERVLAALRDLHRTKKGPWVFRSPRNPDQHIDPSWALKQFQRATEAASVWPAPGENFTLHTLRHTFAYRSRVRDRIPEKTAMKQGGWKTRSAFDRYGIGDDVELDEMFRVADANIAKEEREMFIRRRSKVRTGEKAGEDATSPTQAQDKIDDDE